MRLPDPRPRRAEAPNGLAAAARASGRFPALPENADRELPRPPREVAFLIREPERRSGALTVRISNPGRPGTPERPGRPGLPAKPGMPGVPLRPGRDGRSPFARRGKQER